MTASKTTRSTELKPVIASTGPAGPNLKALWRETIANVQIILPTNPITKQYGSNSYHFKLNQMCIPASEKIELMNNWTEKVNFDGSNFKVGPHIFLVSIESDTKNHGTNEAMTNGTIGDILLESSTSWRSYGLNTSFKLMQMPHVTRETNPIKW